MDKKISKLVAKASVKVLNSVLVLDANSTSCIYAYQPQAPKNLRRFKKTR